MKRLKFPIIFFIICLSSGTYAQYIQVDDTYSAQQLVQNVLIDSPCANVSNFSVSGDTFTPGSNSYGYFTNPSSSFPFANGVVLSTAGAKRSEGPNNNLVDEGSPSWPGDIDLQQALNINNTFNATVLEFDFTPLTSQISFDYIFASEEYSGSAPCQYSDGFAFLLKPAGSSAPYQNLAVLPNSNTPVLVTTVHPAIGGNCGAENEQYFGSFNPPSSPINFNGQTVVLTAKANVVPGTVYHIKLVIADEQNIRYDSAIFLGGGSFHVGTDIGPDRLIATNNPVCNGETFTLDATEPGSNTYQWFKNNVAIAGATNATYTVTDSGTYSVEINLGSSGCIATGEAVIEFTTGPTVNTPLTLAQCDDNNDGITVYDLTKISSQVVVGDPGAQVVYYKNLADAQNQVNPIQNPAAFQNTSANSVIARVQSIYGCANYATVNLVIANNTITPQNPVEMCDEIGPKDGITEFNFTALTTQILTGLPSGLTVNYYASADDAVHNLNPLPNIYTNAVANQQVIYAMVINGPDCYGLIPVTLIVNTFNPAGFEDEEAFLCNGNPITISVANIYSSYTWSSGETGVNIITVNTPGTYAVTVTDANGCPATKNFIVTNSEAATITSVKVNDFTGSDNSLLVHYTGNGHYEFSLDGTHFQDSPLFTNISPGEYLIYINDKNGCGITPPYPVTVMDYPKFFTPNGDGFNDVWQIENLNRQPNATVNIFDRFGKLVYSFKGNGIGWNGRYNNMPLPSTDYWFTILLEDGKIVKSHFSLKR